MSNHRDIWRTYQLEREVAERINAVAHTHQVGISDLVNFLLRDSLTRVESGELNIKAKHAGLKRIVYE